MILIRGDGRPHPATDHTVAGQPRPEPTGPIPAPSRLAIRTYHAAVQILPISQVTDKLNEYVDSVILTHAQITITITKNGSPVAVLIGAAEWESIQETLFWLSQPSVRDTIAEADDDIAAGHTHSQDQIRTHFGVAHHDT